MTTIPKLTAIAACRVARIDRDRFNEHVAAGRFPCAPGTSAGRARLFSPDDMLALVLFSDLLKDDLPASLAGHIACEVAEAARASPEARAISYLRTNAVKSGFTVNRRAIPSDQVPDPETWNKSLFNDCEIIERETIFNVWQSRQRIAQRTEEERSIIGEREEA